MVSEVGPVIFPRRASQPLPAGRGEAILVVFMAEGKSKTYRELLSARETVESVGVAIILAFVLRAFVIEAFVIPTGSMAPRLYGEHLDLHCPACGYEYAYNWSSEGRAGTASPGAGGRPFRGPHCPSCGFDWARDGAVAGGDRVLVMKYLYRFREPQPWDVVVFKNPQDNRQNYIKRLIGLPGEEIEIVHGDVFVRKPGQERFGIRRKIKPEVQRAMWHVVYDNDYRPDPAAFGERNDRADEEIVPPHWDAPVGGWRPAGAHRRHWRFDGGKEAPLVFRPVSNTFLPRYGYNAPHDVNFDWPVDVVSDLKLQAVYLPGAADSRVALTLTAFEYAFRGEIGADGTARLRVRRTDGQSPADWVPLAPDHAGRPLDTELGHEIALTHVDFRVCLWVGGRCVLESRDHGADAPDGVATYPMNYTRLKQRLAAARAHVNKQPIPQPRVELAAAGGACELRHLQIGRDVYYTSPSFREGPGDAPAGRFARLLGVRGGDPGWGTEGHPIKLHRFPGHRDLDQFYVLGDNSPSSLDGRLWTSAAVTLRLYDPAGDLGPPTLAVGDVLHWGRFLKALRDAAGAPRPSPARHLLRQMPAEIREAIRRLRASDVRTGSVGDGLKREVIAVLNRMMASGEVYEARAWREAGARLLPGLAERAGSGDLTPPERAEIGRAALEAAFPGEITTRRRLYQLGTVPRYNMIGKAMFVYWPAGFAAPILRDLPIVPNVGRMRLIR